MLKLVNFVNLIILFTSLTLCPSVQKSSLPFCHLSVATKFDRKVRASSSDFDHTP